jgi:pimeloyl-ACP methyl ester carboxylesterase
MDRTAAVVLLHAFPLNAGMWERQLEALGSREVLTPNFPGFGGRPPGATELDGFARAVIEDMDSAGIDRAVIVGLSMGGYVAFRLHALAPERLAGLVLADTKATGDDESARIRRTDQVVKARQEGVVWLAEALLPALLGKTTMRVRQDVVAAVRAMIATADAEGVARALEAMRGRPDSTPRLAGIKVPVLVVVGEEDTLTPVDEARKIVAGVPDGRLEVIPEAGHLSNLEAPDRFNEALQSFLR